jgi:stage V sporulation protein R
MMRELGLYAYEPRGENLVVTRVADDPGWREVKEVLLRSVGLGGVPVIAVQDADLGGNRTLLLQHDHDGRDLHLDFADRTLRHLRALWGRDVALDTVLKDEPRRLCCSSDGITIESRA